MQSSYGKNSGMVQVKATFFGVMFVEILLVNFYSHRNCGVVCMMCYTLHASVFSSFLNEINFLLSVSFSNNLLYHISVRWAKYICNLFKAE